MREGDLHVRLLGSRECLRNALVVVPIEQCPKFTDFIAMLQHAIHDFARLQALAAKLAMDAELVFLAERLVEVGEVVWLGHSSLDGDVEYTNGPGAPSFGMYRRLRVRVAAAPPAHLASAISSATFRAVSPPITRGT